MKSLAAYLSLAALASRPALAAPYSIADAARSFLYSAAGVVNQTTVIKRNCAYLGMYPDDGDAYYGSQGTLQRIEDLNAAVGTPFFAVGAYAHIDHDNYVPGDPSTYFNGSEIMPFLEQALHVNATFVASVAPVHGYGGFQSNDTNQLDALVDVLSQFVDAGVEIWLRWAHEMNWYTKKGSDDQDPTGVRRYYDQSSTEYVDVWRFTYTTIKAKLPSVQFMWCANIGSNDEIRPFWPGADYVDSVGIDYYTEKGASSYVYGDVISYVKDFHDEFALGYNKTFWLGETGTRSNSSVDNLKWVDTITSEKTCNAMANYAGAFWFNYQKNWIDHRIVYPGGNNVTTAFINLMEN